MTGTPGPSDGAGKLLNPPTFGIARFPRIDARSAAAEALRGYLRAAQFTVWGDKAPDRTFTFNRVDRQWPEPSAPLDVPVAVVLDPDSVREDPFSFVPAPLEETFDVYEPNTVLWKTAEVVMTLQLDVWVGNDPEREAVLATLPALFAPSEDQFGIFVCAPDTYWSLPVRLTLLSTQRMDTPDSVYARERRVMCTIKAEIDEVHLRCAAIASVHVNVETVEPPQGPLEAVYVTE